MCKRSTRLLLIALRRDMSQRESDEMCSAAGSDPPGLGWLATSRSMHQWLALAERCRSL